MWRPPERIRYEASLGRMPSRQEAAAARLFSPIVIGPTTLEQRTWVPAMVPWRATEEGYVTDEVIDWYERFARGRPGAIVVEATGIRDVPSGPLLRIGHDRFLPGLRRLVDTVQEASEGHTRLFIQLIDFLAIRRRPDPEKFFARFLEVTDEHRHALGDPVMPDAEVRARLRALSEDDLLRVLTRSEFEALRFGYRERVTDVHLAHIRDLPARMPQLFADAAVRAQQAGFDGVMALATRKDLFGLHTGINTENIYQTSRLLTQITGVRVQPNKAIVGANAFAHESGIHQDGLIKEKLTYEIMTPQSVGMPESHIVLGKHSGRHAVTNHLKQLGYDLGHDELNRVFSRFKDLADVKKDIFDEDLEAILYEEVLRIDEKFKLVYLNVVSGNVAVPTATMQIEVEGRILQDAGFGVGPVDATFDAIRKITKTNYNLMKYTVNAVTGGTDAQGEATVQLKHNGRSVVGHGAHPDVLVASAKAYVNALNRIEWLNKENPE